jgi:ribonuclease HI
LSSNDNNCNYSTNNNNNNFNETCCSHVGAASEDNTAVNSTSSSSSGDNNNNDDRGSSIRCETQYYSSSPVLGIKLREASFYNSCNSMPMMMMSNNNNPQSETTTNTTSTNNNNIEPQANHSSPPPTYDESVAKTATVEVKKLKEQDFVFVYYNGRAGGGRQAPSIERFLTEFNADVICISDTGMIDVALEIGKVADTYNCSVFHQNRVSANLKPKRLGHAGGALLLVRNKWKPAALKGMFDVNNNNTPWRVALDVAGCEIEITPTQKLKVFSVYVHIQDPADKFNALLAAMPEDAVVCGDMNATLPHLPHNNKGQRNFEPRGKVIDALLENRGWFVGQIETPTVKEGSNALDHILVGPEAQSILQVTDQIPKILPDTRKHFWPSDHWPIQFTATVLSEEVTSVVRQFQKVRIKWDKVTDQHQLEYNNIVSKTLREAAGRNRMDVLVLEKALLKASKCLPRIRSGGTNNNNKILSPSDDDTGTAEKQQQQQKSQQQMPLQKALKRIWWREEDNAVDLDAMMMTADAAVEDAAAGGNTDEEGKPPSLWALVGGAGAVAGNVADVVMVNSLSAQADMSNVQRHILQQQEERQLEKKRKNPLRQRHYVLSRENAKSTNPSSVYEIFQKYFSNKKLKSIVRPPLEDVTNNTTVTESKDRVEVLAKAYAKTHSSVKEGVNVQNDLQQELNNIPSDQRNGRPLSLWEVRTAIDRTQRGKCADFLGITAEHLKLLSDESLKLALPWLSRVVEKAKIPTHWKVAITTPLAKPKKDLSKTPGWRPVSVTAALSRLCEKIIGERIQCRLAELSVIAESQFGFRRNIPPALMLAGLSMFIEDGLRDKTPTQTANGKVSNRANTTLLVGVDGVDAFCRANGAIAVRTLKQHGLHAEAFYVGNLLLGRSLRVREDNEISDAVDLESGVPQGASLSSLLWNLVINPLLKKLEAKCNEDQQKKVVSTVITFADDINFAVKSYDHAACIDKANELLKIIDEWSVESGVPLGKMQSIWVGAPCGGDPKFDWVKNWKKEDGELVCGNLRDVPTAAPPAPPPGFEHLQQVERTFKILGIKFSPSFRFCDHAQDLIRNANRQLCFLRPLATTCSSTKVKVLYEALVLSPLLYCCECWYPYIDAEHRKKLEAIHLDGCRMITRGTLSTRIENVYAEAGFRSFRDLVHGRLVALAERCKRLIGNSEFHGPGWVKKLFSDPVLHRTKPPNQLLRNKPDRREALEYSKRVVSDTVVPTIRDLDDETLEDVEPLPEATPFFTRMDKLHLLDEFIPPSAFDASPPGGLVKSIHEEEELEAANRERMSKLNKDAVFVFPDGSAAGEGATAGVITGGVSVWYKGEEVAVLKFGHGQFGCSYTAEIRTVELLLEWLKEDGAELFPLENGRRPHVYIVTDSRSSISALATGPLRQTGRTEQSCWESMIDLAELKFSISFHFIFSHCGVAGNDQADVYANEAMRSAQRNNTAPIWRKDAVRLRNSIYHAKRDEVLSESVTIRESFCFSPPLSLKLSRADEQLLFRARMDCIPEIGGHLHVCDDQTIYDCPLCKSVGVLGRNGKTIEHVNNCTAAPLPPETDIKKMLWNDVIAALLHLRLFRQARFDMINNNNNDDAAGAEELPLGRQQQEQEVSSSSDNSSSEETTGSESETDSLDSN